MRFASQDAPEHKVRGIFEGMSLEEANCGVIAQIDLGRGRVKSYFLEVDVADPCSTQSGLCVHMGSSENMLLMQHLELDSLSILTQPWFVDAVQPLVDAVATGEIRAACADCVAETQKPGTGAFA